MHTFVLPHTHTHTYERGYVYTHLNVKRKKFPSARQTLEWNNN